jgi:hypothetical protein
MTGLDDEPTFEDVWAMSHSVFEHAAQVDLVEPPVLHSLEEMRAKLEAVGVLRWLDLTSNLIWPLTTTS